MDATTQLAEHFLVKGDYDNALENYQHALAASKRIKEYQFEIDALCNLGQAFLKHGASLSCLVLTFCRSLGNMNDALINFGKARSLAISRNDEDREASTLEHMMKTTIAMANQVCPLYIAFLTNLISLKKTSTMKLQLHAIKNVWI